VSIESRPWITAYSAFWGPFHSMATALRMPVAKRRPSVAFWLNLLPSKTQTPPYFSRIGHGFLPSEPSSRSFCWQEFEGAPTFTYTVPLGPARKSCRRAGAPSGSRRPPPASAGRRKLALLQLVAVHADVVGDVQPVLEEADLGALHVAELHGLVGLAVAILVAHGQEPVAAGEVDVAIGGHGQVAPCALAFLYHGSRETLRQREPIGVGRHGGVVHEQGHQQRETGVDLTTLAKHVARMSGSLEECEVTGAAPAAARPGIVQVIARRCNVIQRHETGARIRYV
jgi:hypothetical protein